MSYQEYVSHFQLRQEQLAARVSDQHILELADKIIRWEEDLVGPLELTREEINDIHEETSKPKLKRYQLFCLRYFTVVVYCLGSCFFFLFHLIRLATCLKTHCLQAVYLRSYT